MTRRGVRPSRSVLCGDTPRAKTPPTLTAAPTRTPPPGGGYGACALPVSPSAARRVLITEASMRRIALPLLLALSSLAFAPAPVPKPKRQARPVAGVMEGLWRRPHNGGTVRITAATWTNNPERGGRPHFDVTTDPRASPATFDMSEHGATKSSTCVASTRWKVTS